MAFAFEQLTTAPAFSVTLPVFSNSYVLPVAPDSKDITFGLIWIRKQDVCGTKGAANLQQTSCLMNVQQTSCLLPADPAIESTNEWLRNPIIN